MKELTACISAVFITAAFARIVLIEHQIVRKIDYEAFRTMDCEPLFDSRGKEIKPPENCTFGGSYAWSHPLDYQITLVTPSNFDGASM